jgi:hypothetical protein
MKSTAALVAAVSLATGLVVSRPLPAELSSGLPVGTHQPVDLPVLSRFPGDTLQLYYQLWLVRDGLLGPTPAFTDPYQFRIDGARWNLPQAFLPLSLPFTVLSFLGSHVAYNLLVLLSFPVTALAGYGLTRAYTADPRAALVAGLGFALLPARLAPLFGGQPAGFAMALVPAVLWGLDGALMAGSRASGLGGGLAFLALAMLEPQYTYLVAGFLVAHAVVRGLTGRPRPAGWALLPFVLLAAGGAGWVLMLRHAFVAGSVAEAGRRLDEVRLYSPGLAGLADPATFGGLAMGALALVGLGERRDREQAGFRLVFGAAFLLGIVLSLGPALPRLPLYQALHRWLPFFGMIRNPAKLHVLTALGGLVLAALGAQALLARLAPGPGPRRDWLTAGLAGLVLVVTVPWHGIAVARFGDSPVYEALRRGATRVLYLPLWPGDSAYSSVYLYAVTRTRVPAVNGYSALVPRRYVPDVFEHLAPMNVGDLGAEEAETLHRLGVSHVVVDRSVFPPEVSPYPSAFSIEHLRASPALALVRADNPLWLFRVTGAGPGPAGGRATSPVGFFLEAEWQSHETGTEVAAAEASGGRAVVGRPGQDRPGFLTFGPYRTLPAGTYVARFRVRGPGLHVDVAVDRGRRRLAERAAEPGAAWSDVTLPFTVERARPLELRVAWDGRSAAAVDWVLAVAADRPDPEWTYEVERLPHQLGEREDAAASGGWAGYAPPGVSPKRALVTGPRRLFPAGRYQLSVRVRAEGVGHGPLIRLSVTTPAGPELAGRIVDATEVAPGAYRDVTLDFALDRERVLEFPVAYLADVGVFFDRVTITPR